MTFYSIQDFRKTDRYQIAKLRNPEVDIRDLAILNSGVEIVPHRTLYLEDDFIEDIKDSMCTLNKIVRLAEGIYDIWLRSCKNLKTIRMHIEGVGDVYTRHFTESYEGDVQIPLAFDTDNQRVKALMFTREYWNNKVSFIPTIAIRVFNKISIHINEGAEAQLRLSTLYVPTNLRREMCNKTQVFYINGKPYHYDNHKKNWLYSSPERKEGVKKSKWCFFC
jgi:hypothetical protein